MSKTAQAGAIAFNVADNKPRILLVRAKKTPNEWIFPKGHIEKGETAEAAALRELEEEAGVRGESIAFIGSLEFQSGDELVDCAYYLIKFLAEVTREEKRQMRWCEVEEALRLLSHADAAGLLRKALPQIETYALRS